MSAIFVPNEFYCPITGELMKDPVTEPEGHTYEESFIKEWLTNKQESPMTRTPLTINQLQENTNTAFQLFKVCQFDVSRDLNTFEKIDPVVPTISDSEITII